MLKETIKKLLNNPLLLIKNIIAKGIINPIKYGKQNDYDAKRYWSDRFLKHGNTLIATGDEGISEKQNIEAYEEANKAMLRVCKQLNIDFHKLKTLEIGCGTGFYTEFLHKLNVQDYTGIDITDVMFEELKFKFPRSVFLQKDITTDNIEVNHYDLVFMIDVIEHIVTPEKLNFAMKNIKASLKENGTFILAPIMNKTQRRLFHLHSWTFDDIKQNFQENHFSFSDPIPFRGNFLVVISRNT